MFKDTLGDEIKAYEDKNKHFISQEEPIIIRVDGKSFHTFTSDLEKPWDINFQKCMIEAAIYTAEEIQNCKLLYTQSDECTFLMVPNIKNESSQIWFNGKQEKIISVAAALMSVAFYKGVVKYLPQKMETYPAFDARVFNVPWETVKKVFIWRQLDAIRNSVQMVARSQFSHKECHKKNTEELKRMIASTGKSWEQHPTYLRLGTAAYKHQVQETIEISGKSITVNRNRWKVDYEIPLFKEHPEYIDERLRTEEE